MKWFVYLILALSVGGCAARQQPAAKEAPADIGIVNHTGNYIYSATVNGSGGANMGRWAAGMPDVCCTTIPLVWHPGIKVLVRWNMPEGIKDVIREKVVEIEKYDEPGSIYLHFFPNDQVRVIVSNYPGPGPKHPIPPPQDPAKKTVK